MSRAIGLYFRGMSREQINALRARLNAQAAEFGYTAIGGPTAGEGNLAALLMAVDAGEVALVLLPPEHQAQAARWLEARAAEVRDGAQDFEALALAEALDSIAGALRKAMERAARADMRSVAESG